MINYLHHIFEKLKIQTKTATLNMNISTCSYNVKEVNNGSSRKPTLYPLFWIFQCLNANF